MHASEAIRLLEWEDKRNSGEIRRISNEIELLHDQVIGLVNEIDGLKESLKKLSGSASESDDAGNPYDIEEDDIVF